MLLHTWLTSDILQSVAMQLLRDRKRREILWGLGGHFEPYHLAKKAMRRTD